MKKTLLLTLLCCINYFVSVAQTDNTFWFVIPEVSQNGGSNLDRPIFLRMTAFATAATVTISQPAGGGMPTLVLTIPANSTISQDLTPWINVLENKPANTVLNYGLEISSTAPITAYYDVVSGACLCNPEDFVLKGNNALGTDFWIPGQDTLNNSASYTPTPSNAFDIVATQNGTTVTITPSNNIVGHLAGVPFTVLLNQGQTYCAQATSTLGINHLRGSRVTSDKPIAITEKDDLLSFFPGWGGGDDLIGDQIVPVSVLGKEYIPMYGNLAAPGDQIFVTATQNATTVSLNGTLLTTLSAGQTCRMNCPNPSGYVQTSFPAYVYQLSGIRWEVGSALLPQINCTGSNSVSFQQSSTIDFKLNLLVKSGGIGGFLVNGVAGVITAGMFAPVPATGGLWYSAQVTLPVATYPLGTVLTVANPGYLFQLGFLSSGPPNSGADFGYFSNYGGVNPNPTTTTPSVCVGDSVHLFADTITGASYSWIGPGGFTNTAQNPFVAGSTVFDSGTYKVYVTTPGCLDSGTVDIAVHPYPAVDLGNDTTVCTSPYTLQSIAPAYLTDTYLWNTSATTSSISVTATGAYWVAISNAGCTKSDTINLTVDPVTAPTVTPVTYCQYNTAVPLTATGVGLRWYTSAVGGAGSSVAPTPSTTVPGVTTYYVTSFVAPCESPRVPLAVTVNASPFPPLVTGIGVYCYGVPFVPFAITGTNVLWYTSPTGGIGDPIPPTISTTTPGVYTFYATQTIAGCESPRQPETVTVLEKIIPSFTYTPHYGCKMDTAVFTNTTTGASLFTWNFGDGYSDTNANPIHIYRQGIYTVTLLASNHYCSDSIQLKDSLIHELHASFVDTPFIYCQDSLVTLTNTTDATNDIISKYKWLFGDGSTSTMFSTSHVYKNSGEYNVQLIATDFVPCSDTASLKIFIDSTTGLHLSVTDSVICRSTYVTFGGSYTGIGNIGVTWDFGDGDSIKNVNPVSHAYDNPGTYTVTLRTYYRACRDTATTKTFTIYPAPQVSLGNDASICPGSNVVVIGDTINQPGPRTAWLWSTGETTPSINVSEPGHYWVTVTIDGCSSTDTLWVKNDCYMNVPNVFTPNGDGMNDYFFPRGMLTMGLTSFSMNIYNRWGQLVFQTNSLDGAGWDGKFNDVSQPEGVYVYVIDAKFKDGQKERHQGNVTLLR